MSNQTQYDTDVLVVGAGPAGLQAAITVGRVHRRVLLVDSGRPRNAPARHMHNFLTHDGTDPAAFRRTARAELTDLPDVILVDAEVTSIERTDHGFHATLDSSEPATVEARRVVLATGVRDSLPEIPGLAELFGHLVHHCPFCHGHELAGGRVGILASPRTAHLAAILEPVAGDLVMLEGVTALAEEDGRVRVTFTDGSTDLLDGVFTPTEPTPSAPYAEQLGAELNPSGAVAVDLFGRTSVPGLLAAGDGAHHRDLPMAMSSVLAAAAAGQAAGGACVADLMS